jgi:hypothetical protein
VTRLVLVASPFTGAGVWRAMASQLPGAIVADYRPLEGPDWYGTMAARVAVQAGEEPWIAVLHSGAGGFAPALAEAAPGLAGFVFADAVLPYPGKTCLGNAPEWLAQAMRRLNGPDGRLAPWNRWFPEDPLPSLVPDAAARAALQADLPRTPFAFLEALSQPSTAWARLPSAYLQLSKGYADTAAAAEAMGWPVARARLNHLAMVSHPAETAALVAALADRLA